MDLHDSLLIFSAFSSGINAIATGALIDMHTMRYKRRKQSPPLTREVHMKLLARAVKILVFQLKVNPSK